MTPEADHQRSSLYPDGLGMAELYWSAEALAKSVDAARSAGWRVVEFDISEWDRSDRLHDDVAQLLPLPDHYGRNLDALSDVLNGIADGSSASISEPGIAIVIDGSDRLAAVDRSRLSVVMKLLADALLHGLRHGWPLSILIRTDDPDLTMDPLTSIRIEWNRAERQRASRG